MHDYNNREEHLFREGRNDGGDEAAGVKPDEDDEPVACPVRNRDGVPCKLMVPHDRHIYDYRYI